MGLALFAALYGTHDGGFPNFSRTELPRAEQLDGTLFLRAAQLTAMHFELRRGKVSTVDLPLWDYRFPEDDASSAQCNCIVVLEIKPTL